MPQDWMIYGIEVDETTLFTIWDRSTPYIHTYLLRFLFGMGRLRFIAGVSLYQ